MSMFGLDRAKQRKLIALGLLVMLLVFLMLVVMMPLMSFYRNNSLEIDMLEQRLLRYNDKIAKTDQVIKQAEDKQAKIRKIGVFSAESSVALVFSDIQQHVRTAVTAANGELSSVQNLPQNSQGGLLKVGIKIQFSGEMNTLTRVLRQVETAKPYLIIENIKIMNAPGNHSNNTGKIKSADKVHVSADIFSYVPVSKP